MRIKFDYIDGKGKNTSRIVKDIRVKNYAIIEGFCELRKAERTFYIGGISRPFDLEKNEPIENIMYFLGIIDDDGEIKAEYQDEEKDEPPPLEIKCPKCGGLSEITRAWALENDRFVCECGQGFTITKEKKNK